MITIGITGNIGCGKSAVSGILEELGAIIIDADKISHKCLDDNKDLVIDNFKKLKFDIANDLVIDREKLSSIVFDNKEALDELCKILHPCVIDNIKSKLSEIKHSNPQALVAIDCPLLFEANLQDMFDYILVVSTFLNARIDRLTQKGFSKDEVIKIDKHQMFLESKLKEADFIVDNNKDLIHTKSEVKKILNEINQGG